MDPSAFNEILTIVAAIITSCLSKDDLLQILTRFLEVFAQPLKSIRERIMAELISIDQYVRSGTIMTPEAKQAIK